MSIFGIDLGPIDDVTGAITGAGENLLGSLTGESDIGRIEFEPVDAFESERAQRLERRTETAAKEQAGATGLLGEAARGEVPSAAEMQQRRGLAASLRGERALASSARGGAGAQILAQREAGRRGAAARTEIIGQTGELRAREMAAAREAFAKGVAQQRMQEQAQLALAMQEQARQDELMKQIAIAEAGGEVEMFGAGLGFLGGALSSAGVA